MRKLLTLLFNLFLLTLVAFGQRGKIDSLQGFRACTIPVVYAVNDVILKDQFGKTLSVPETNPAFKGDVDELKKYFAANPLTDPKAKDLGFRVHIGFLVNCNGQFGNLIIVSKGKGDLDILAKQVLSIAEKMPQNWVPAMADNKLVDCYQILSFTVIDGALDKVSYRK
ncbi:MAG: hypothetical protein HOP10_05705 [Chitinophagaceae bacterium]|nr:hypothetical protein [Chitinophagaceae bacterium]